MEQTSNFKPVEFLKKELENLSNSEVLLFDMPTGFGKTRAIINYINYSLDNIDNETIVFVTNLEKDLIEVEKKLDRVSENLYLLTFKEFLQSEFENATIFIDEFDASKKLVDSLNPEEIIIGKLINNRSILISATIKIFTTFDSYNFDILKNNLKIRDLSSEFKNVLRKESEFRNQRYRDLNIKIEFDSFEFEQLFTEFNKLNIYSFLYLKDKNRKISTQNQDILFLNIENIQKELNHIKKRLKDGKRTFVIADFECVNAGQNIHYEINKLLFEELNLITLYPNKKEIIKKDFDSIYIDFPFTAECLNKSLKNYLIKLVIQSIGRINKTNLKAKDVHIFLDYRYKQILKEFDFSDFILLEEMRSIVEFAKNY